MLFRNLTASVLAVGSLALFAGTANAQVPLAAGQTTTAFAGGPFGGTQIGSLVSNYNFSFGNQTISGTVTSAAFTGAAGNAAGVDFIYQVTLAGTSNSNLTNLNFASFSGFTSAVAQTNDGDGAGGTFVSGTVASAQAGRTVDGEGMFFNFGGAANSFTPGATSFSFIVRTNATSFVTGSVGVNGSGIGTTTSALAPSLPGAQAPEPGSVALLGVGFAGMAGLVARRRKAA